MNIDEKLIEMVRSHVELYDLSHAKYMDSGYKDIILIDNNYFFLGKICKTRWNNIRDNYRKSIKKTTSGQAFKRNKIYKYDDQLQFLKPHLQERYTLGNLNDVNNDDLENSNNDSEDDVENVSTVQNIEIGISGNTDGEDQLPKTKESQSAASSILMKYIMQKRENDIANTTQTHSVDAFLAGLSSILKSFTPYYLNIYNQNFPSSSAQHLNHNTYPGTQLQKDMSSPSISNYSSSPPSPQVSHVTSISNTKNIIEYDISSPTTTVYSSTPSPQFVSVPNDTLAPTSTISPIQYLSSPPFPFLDENIASYTQNLTHLQRIRNISNQYTYNRSKKYIQIYPQICMHHSQVTNLNIQKLYQKKNPGENESAAK
ncbi:hypothetical protein QTP88_008753 [Uroleucon formosanum]